jgi:hypothetical protein
MQMSKFKEGFGLVGTLLTAAVASFAIAIFWFGYLAVEWFQEMMQQVKDHD